MINSEKAVLIMGTGAMACLFGARLSAAGIPVWIYGTWADGLQALKSTGIKVVGHTGEEHIYPVHVAIGLEECRGVKNTLLLVKSWQTPRAAGQLAECLASDGVVLTLQNGLGNREELTKTLGARRVSLGVTTLGATLLSPGVVKPAGEGVISLSPNALLTPLIGLLHEAGFVIEIEPNSDALLWGKLVVNAAINPLTALLRVPNGELLTRTSARTLLQAVAREAASVATAQGVRLPYPDPVVAAETIARKTAANHSSMLQDILRGAPTEIDAICGAIVQAGESLNIPTPIIRTIWLLVRSIK